MPTMLRCVECGKDMMGAALDWRAYLTLDDEVYVYCPDCGEREFGARGENGKQARPDGPLSD
ncbi:MAG TPA: hypothetical protein VNP93_01805 [Gaiellaceae bacterium]|nr:hypothetical protein [Gaiellaceae bacterium]